MGAHPSEYAGEDPCRRRRQLPGCDPTPPMPHGPKPSTGPVVEVEVEVEAPSGYATAGKVLFVAAGAFAGVLLALIALHLYTSGWRRRAREGRRLHRSLAIYVEAPLLRRLDPLDPAVLRALPVVPAAVGAGDCAVCLAEFERGEEARALPRCGHRFHVECIDAWFRGNSTCPLCRAAVEAPDYAEARPVVRVDVAADDDAAAKGGAPATGRMSSGTELDKTRRVSASTRSASF
ncbi:hypothetical protein VPH35_042898 [Triticum aestivum]|uniref:RING-H2 finger protein ATL5 n=1 Tax=Triticum aestivum TaxID=4565 RepID=UPI0019499A11|nr:RING-H2 finger protein ATL5-like [Triticum aestivum]